ncbi:MAG: primosomal protein N' [Bacteroidia bacterium]|nr:primosomal protein N' [Bacteroidia bacterium]
MQLFIDVILPIPLEKLFTYSVTSEEAEIVEPGIRVAVPFGKTKLYTAIVYQIHDDPPQVYEAKPIHQVLDDAPVVTPTQFKLWSWMSAYYMCTLGEIMRSALPSAFLLESETMIVLNKDKEHDESRLNDDEFLVFEALQHQQTLKADNVGEILDKKSILPILKNLYDKDVIHIFEEVREKYKPKLVRFVQLNDDYSQENSLEELLKNLNRAPKQRDALMAYFSLHRPDKPLVKVSELKTASRATSSQIKSLIEKGIFSEQLMEIDRIESYKGLEGSPKALTPIQESAFDQISENFKACKITLLHGVTSSGKTEIYVKLIREVIDRGQQVLYLVPEIALTTQLVSRMNRFFGKELSVYHSRYSLNERVEVWQHVRQQSEKAKIVLGARSAVLLPYKNLGLIIIDEEHEPSYKQFDPAPRYHARDTAVILADLFKANTVMGSATPSIESYYNTTTGKYRLVELKERYNKLLMPAIEIVDLKDKYRRKRMTGHFSDRLLELITETLNEKNQVILFQNRRGFSPIVECGTCGHSPQCLNCDVSLTYHQYRDQLRCHYCGHHMNMIKTCAACGSPDLDSKGFGTEQIEEEAKALFPEARVSRMDLDTTRGKHSYDKIISALENREIDILVGTQMLTKGLDFRHVKVVGIMNADSMLNFPDFRAHERSFQLMQQVAGRSGRTDEQGKVIIQSFNPFHRIVQQVSDYNYTDMFNEQLEDRRNYHYPPFYRLIRITLRHKDFNKVNSGAEWMAKALRLQLRSEVLGPEFPPIARIRRQYNKNILIKIGPGQPIQKTKEAILKIRNSFLSVKDFRPIRVILNVDYY